MKRVTMLLCAMLACQAMVADMTHEETVVRTAYARFAYATSQAPIGDLALEAGGNPIRPDAKNKTPEQRFAETKVSCSISNFVVGNVGDVLDHKLSEFITQPVSEMLEVASVEGMGYGGVRWNYLRLHWLPAPAMNSVAAALTIREELQELWKDKLPSIQRYVSYSVTVNLNGKSLGPYRAMFLFGNDAQGSEHVLPLDPNTSAIGLGQALAMDLSPAAFTQTRLRSSSVVKNWLTENQMSGAACVPNEPGRKDVCCDLVRMKCGPSSTDVATGLAMPERN
jgi:hypothetical protein